MYDKMIDVKVIAGRTFFDLNDLAHVVGIDDPVNARYEIFPDKVVQWVGDSLRVFLNRNDALKLAYSSRYNQQSKLACWIDVAYFRNLRGVKAPELSELEDKLIREKAYAENREVMAMLLRERSPRGLRDRISEA